MRYTSTTHTSPSFDILLLTNSLYINIKPPVIHNLPAVSSINENTKTESKLYTLNVTDDSAYDVITCYIQETTPQMVDFYMRRTQLTTNGLS